MSEGKLTPIGYDYGGRPEYDVPPLYHGEPLYEFRPGMSFEEQFAIKPGTDWYSCPNCDEELTFSATHDRYTEGYAPEAVPDQWWCTNCDYRWTE